MSRLRVAVFMAALLTLAACSVPRAKPPMNVPEKGARMAVTAYLSEAGPAKDDAHFDYPRRGAQQTTITLAPRARTALPASLSCDGPARLVLEAGPDMGRYLRPGATARFTLPSRLGTAPRLRLPPETASCALTWGDNRLTLAAEDRDDPPVAALDTRTETCIVPPAARLDPLARAFFASRPLSETCPAPTGAFRLYPNETKALALRLSKLTGSTVTPAQLNAGDPDMPLDFSHAPHYDEIVVSYLHIRADLSGYLVTRALAWHAAHGTRVRIAVANGLMLGLDRRLIEALATRYPNVQIQYFRWQPRGFFPPGQIVNTYQRAHHVKIFAALSREPGASFVLVGGRNLHDMFFFPELPDRPHRPYLHDYDPQATVLQNPFAFFNPYEDFEIALFDRARVADVVAQFGKWWTRDRNGTVMAPMVTATKVSPAAPRSGLVRHFLSLPWADGQDQEAYYVSLIDAAQKEVLAISPFTYPTPAIEAALDRAERRGVKVRLVTRLISGEPPAMFVNGLNTDYFLNHEQEFEIHGYTPPNRLLHTKLIVIDSRLAIVASTNLNARSFYHDSENGLVFLDDKVAGEIHALIERYVAHSEPLSPKPFFVELGKVLSHMPGVEQFF